MLTCTRCGDTKPADTTHFPPHKHTKSGFDSWCRVCRRAYKKLYRKPPDGISKAEWHAHDGIQNCLICGVSEVMLVTDHCHTTLKVRGKLCTNCNLGLGHFKDDPALLEFARVYLMWHSEDEAEAATALAYVSCGLSDDTLELEETT